jgi:hypothetical protein
MQERSTLKLSEHAASRVLARSNSLFSERSGRTLVLAFEKDADTLEVRAPDGTLEFSIRLTPEGPVLQLRSTRIELVGTRDVQVKCGRFSVEATEDVVIHAEGDITQRAGGRAVVDATGNAEINAHAIELGARLGGIGVRANDDVVVAGERIYLNP